MAKPEPQLVLCKWSDAWGDSGDSVFPQDAHEKNKPTLMETLGWMLCSNEDGISLFNEKCEDGSYRSRTFVPSAMVVSVTPYKLVKPRTPKPKPVS